MVDAKDGYWQKRLDTESRYKTTFNMPFGHYRWMRMPFGISSAPEVWQHTMHEFVEDLEGVEVIADDFLIAGFGRTDHEVNQSLERNEHVFFKKCRLWNLKFNRVKCEIHGSPPHVSRANVSLRKFRPYCRCRTWKMSLHWSDSCVWGHTLQSLCPTYQRWKNHLDIWRARMWSSSG